MVVEKIFSEIEGDEKLFSILMDEEEYALYSEFLKEFGFSFGKVWGAVKLGASRVGLVARLAGSEFMGNPGSMGATKLAASALVHDAGAAAKAAGKLAALGTKGAIGRFLETDSQKIAREAEEKAARLSKIQKPALVSVPKPAVQALTTTPLLTAPLRPNYSGMSKSLRRAAKKLYRVDRNNYNRQVRAQLVPTLAPLVATTPERHYYQPSQGFGTGRTGFEGMSGGRMGGATHTGVRRGRFQGRGWSDVEELDNLKLFSEINYNLL